MHVRRTLIPDLPSADFEVFFVLTLTRSLVLVFVLNAGFLPIRPLWGDEANVLDSLLSAIEQSRKALVSGVAEARGTRRLTDGSMVVLDGEMKLLIAFEPNDKFRFDRSEPCLSTSVPIDRGNSQASMCVSRYARDNSKSYFLGDGEFAVVVNEAGKVPHFRTPPFDVRALGLYFWQSFERGKELPDIVAGLRKSRLIKHSIADIVTLECELGNGMASQLLRLHVDTKAGFTPVLLEAFKKSSGAETFEELPFLVERVEWEAVGGVYVPTAFFIQDTFVPRKSREVQFKLKWQYVNEDVPDAFFSESSFEESSLKALVDMRSGEPMLLRPLPESEFPEIVINPSPLGLSQWALIANFTVLFLIFVHIGWGFFKNRKI